MIRQAALEEQLLCSPSRMRILSVFEPQPKRGASQRSQVAELADAADSTFTGKVGGSGGTRPAKIGFADQRLPKIT
jgi:hypothetical protein